MFQYFSLVSPQHLYSVSTIGAKVKSKTFTSREEANRYMYKMVEKLGLGQLNEVYDDHHEKTYIYDRGVSFYINRAC